MTYRRLAATEDPVWHFAHDRAYWLSKITLGTGAGTGDVDATSGRGTTYSRIPASGSGTDEAGSYTFTGADPVRSSVFGDNRLAMTTTGLSALTVDTTGALLCPRQQVTLEVTADRPVTVTMADLGTALTGAASTSVRVLSSKSLSSSLARSAGTAMGFLLARIRVGRNSAHPATAATSPTSSVAARPPATMPGVTPPLPPVEQVRPGLWSIPVPLPMSSLRYVLVYAFETPRGVYLVDAGWDTDEAFAALTAGLATTGHALADVRGVLVTHIHPDHYGLAGRVRAGSGAWIGLHPAGAELVHSRYTEPADLLAAVGRALAAAGAPPAEVASLRDASMPVHALVDVVEPDVLIADGDRPEVPGWDLRAVHTPGHSPGHLCFWVPGERLLLSGDHVLPRITPNISFHPQSGPDPLGAFLASLDKVDALDVDLVLPAHEHRFVGLSARVTQLREHHVARFAEVVRAVAEGRDTAWEVAACMSWSRPWAQIDGFMRRAAVGEALAHLHALQVRGTLAATAGMPQRWLVNAAAAMGG